MATCKTCGGAMLTEQPHRHPTPIGTPDRCAMCQRVRGHASHLPGVFYHHTFEAPTPSGTPDRERLGWGEDVYSVECHCGALGNETHALDCATLGGDRKRDPRVDWDAIERLVDAAIRREEITAARGAEILGIRLETWRDVARDMREGIK